MEKRELNFVSCSFQTDTSLEELREIVGNKVSLAKATDQVDDEPSNIVTLVGTRTDIQKARDLLYNSGVTCAVNNPFTATTDLQDLSQYQPQTFCSKN